MTFYVPLSAAKEVQELVKKNDGRFVGNPLLLGGRVQVTASFDDVQNGNAFSRDLNALLNPQPQSVTRSPPTRFARLWRYVKGRWRGR